MPIKIQSYYANGLEVRTQEASGSRFVATCANKATAKRIAQALNQTLKDSK
jgi:hypothetical protein